MKYMLRVVLFALFFGGTRTSAQWTHIDTLTRNTARDESELQSLCVDAGDTLHAAWAGDIGGAWKIFYSRKSPAGTWALPLSLTDSVPSSFMPALAVGPAGRQVAVTYRVSYGVSDEIGLSWDSAGVWRWTRITVNGWEDLSPTVAFDGQGHLHLAWIGKNTSDNWKIYYATNRTGAWVLQLLAGSDLGPFGSGAVPFIVVTSSGAANIFYRGGDYGTYHIHHAHNAAPGDTSWTYDILNTPNGNDFSASGFVTSDGTIHLLISGNDGFGFPPHAYYTKRPPGGSWSTPDLANTTGNGWGGSLVIDRFGRAHITWNETSGNIYTGHLFYASNSSGSWMSTPIASDGKTYNGVLVLDAAGVGHALAYNGDTFPTEEIVAFRSPGPLTPVRDRNDVPFTMSLSQNYPNPFNPKTEIEFLITELGMVSIKVYDVLGREVATLVNTMMQPGSYEVTWEAASFAGGVYYYRLESGGKRLARRMVLLK